MKTALTTPLDFRKAAPQLTAWILLLVSLSTPAMALWMYLKGCSSGPFDIFMPIAGALFGVIGRILTHYRSNNRMSWLIAFSGAAFVILPAGQYTICGLADPLAFPYFVWSKIFESIGAMLLIIPIFVLIPATFPDGKMPAGRITTGIKALLGLAVVASAVSILAPGPLGSEWTGFIDVENPVGLDSAILEYLKGPADRAMPLLAILATVLAVITFISRFRRATGEARQQFKVFGAFLTSIVLIHIVGFELLGSIFIPEIFDHWSYEVILLLSFGGFPVVIGLVIFRYRLYDIDLIIRRTLSYAILTGLLALIYFGTVVTTQNLFQGITGNTGTPLVTVVSTLAIAALFNPLRIRVQEFIDRRFYRAKYDAEKALLSFAQTTRDEVDLDLLSAELLHVVNHTMKPEKIFLYLEEPDR